MLPGEFLLRDGTPALIWPLLWTDAGALREGFERLSPGSRRLRFLTALSALEESMIHMLVDSVDGVHHIALTLLVLPAEDEERPVGVARLRQDPRDPAIADIAVTVADDWQRRGVGTALTSALLERRPPEVTRLRVLVADGNRGSLALLARIGRSSSRRTYPGVTEVIVDLPDVVTTDAGKP